MLSLAAADGGLRAGRGGRERLAHSRPGYLLSSCIYKSTRCPHLQPQTEDFELDAGGGSVSIYLSIYLSMSIYQSIYLSIYLSISICIYIYMYTYQYVSINQLDALTCRRRRRTSSWTRGAGACRAFAPWLPPLLLLHPFLLSSLHPQPSTLHHKPWGVRLPSTLNTHPGGERISRIRALVPPWRQPRGKS